MNPVIQVIRDTSEWRCSCGENAFTRSGGAKRHNSIEHNNQAKIMEVEEFIEEAVDVDLEFYMTEGPD